VDAAKKLGLWCVVAVLSVATLVLYVDNFRTKDCLSGYMQRDAAATKARADAADLERIQFRSTLQVLVSGETDPSKRQKAITDYIDLLNKDDAIRRNNPPLPVPTECD
jgi:hypothetical protein